MPGPAIDEANFSPYHLFGDGMHFGENRMLFLRNFFNPWRLFPQLIKNGNLSGGDSVHPPET